MTPQTSALQSAGIEVAQAGWSALSSLARRAIDFIAGLLPAQVQTQEPRPGPAPVQSQLSSAPNIGLLTERPGGQPKETASYSHFNDPITFFDGALHGNSRRWGDAPAETQNAVISEILNQTSLRGWSTLNQSFALALARVESGFNPDAAAGSTSASGIGQLIDATASALGLQSESRFSIQGNVGAMLDLIDQNRLIAEERFPGSTETAGGLALQYALYHDGPSLNYGGLEIAQQQVVPWAEKINNWLGAQAPQYQTPLESAPQADEQVMIAPMELLPTNP